MNIFHRKHQLPVQKSIFLAQKSLIQNNFPGWNRSLFKNQLSMFKKSICHVKLYYHIQKFISMIRNFITHLQEILCLCESFPPPRSTSRYFYANEKYFYASKKYLHAKENWLICCWMEVWQLICWEVKMSDPQSTESLVLRLLTCLIMLL